MADDDLHQALRETVDTLHDMTRGLSAAFDPRGGRSLDAGSVRAVLDAASDRLLTLAARLERRG